MRIYYQKGILFLEVVIILLFIVIGATALLHSLLAIIENEKAKKLKIQLQEAILTAIKTVTISHETLAFCIGNDKKCFTKPTMNGFIFTDDYHDGTIHNDSQIRKTISFSKVNGDIFYRSFPHYRHSLVFKVNSWIESDNGTFWFCKQNQNKPLWGFSINRFAMMQDLRQNKHGDIIDSKGKPLRC